MCTAHPNVKLLLSLLNLSKDYHELLELIVRDRNSRKCMIHHCESCRGVNVVKKFIEGELKKTDADGQVGKLVTMMMWKSLSSSRAPATRLN